MCATYRYTLDFETINAYFSDIAIDEASPLDKITGEVYPFTMAPVLVLKDNVITISAKRYSLTPTWAKEEKVKWATYNARMNRENAKTGTKEFIYEVPTWKSAFGRRHCLVPMNSFHESCHDGKANGHMVNFKPKDSGLLFAAGIYEDWVNQKTGEVISTFAIVTTEPDDFIKDVGHDRSPVFLQSDTAITWLNPFKSSKDAYVFLENSLVNPKLDYDLVRKLKSTSQVKLSAD